MDWVVLIPHHKKKGVASPQANLRGIDIYRIVS